MKIATKLDTTTTATTSDQTHAPWCGKGTPTECEEMRMHLNRHGLGNDEGECWAQANEGARRSAYECDSGAY